MISKRGGGENMIFGGNEILNADNIYMLKFNSPNTTTYIDIRQVFFKLYLSYW